MTTISTRLRWKCERELEALAAQRDGLLAALRQVENMPTNIVTPFVSTEEALGQWRTLLLRAAKIARAAITAAESQGGGS